MMMSKDEFLLRMSVIGKGKLAYFKKIAQRFIDGLPKRIDSKALLNQLAMSQTHKALFASVSDHEIGLITTWLDDCSSDQPKKMIAYCDLDYPPLLKQISSPPALLFVHGNAALLHSQQIAMVGSRVFSEYGAQWARYFASELAINGMTITSGLALGIDAICHRGALSVSGKTIAVLGSGLSLITPHSNKMLANDILAANGALVSEFLPFEHARPEYFPRRNRIISGLSLGTFVVEAGEKSGSLITARYALEQNRDVFALPGEISNENCLGTHALIKQGAYLVSRPTDILEHYSGYLANVIQPPADNDNHAYPLLYPELFAMIHYQPIPIDRIAEQANLPTSDVAVKLLDMELEGLIKAVTGGYIRNRIS